MGAHTRRLGRRKFREEDVRGTPSETEFFVVPVTAKMLRDRLPEVLATAMERGEKVYHETARMDSPEIKAFSDFVELAEKKERGARSYTSCWLLTREFKF